jgi:hypothetical protein
MDGETALERRYAASSPGDEAVQEGKKSITRDREPISHGRLAGMV